MKELERKSEDKIEIVKQQQKKQTLILQKRILPHENHLLFEYNYKDKKLDLAKYEPIETTINWFDAVELVKNKNKKVDILNPNPIQKSKVIQQKDCIYISALNFQNAIKVLKRDYKIML